MSIICEHGYFCGNCDQAGCSHNASKIMADFDRQIAEEEKRIEVPVCHFTPMSYEASDDQEWWICHHCGHTKEIGMMDFPHGS